MRARSHPRLRSPLIVLRGYAAHRTVHCCILSGSQYLYKAVHVQAASYASGIHTADKADGNPVQMPPDRAQSSSCPTEEAACWVRSGHRR